ncbi:hypothetical protein AB0E63_27970 [Kribbella sp. NPDC026596]|uniref:hypothetical protein n=1 Tax=Kribbella sp. NPDC026596 TaxID=3155122 RepID=UPI0033DA4553
MRDEFLGMDALKVAVTPARVVYLFPNGDRNEFRRAVQEASSRWAGVTEPIVPVLKNGKLRPVWEQVVEVSGVIHAVNVGCSDDDATKAAERLGLPLISITHIDRGISGRTLHWSAVADTRGVVPTAARPQAPLWEVVAAGDPQPPSDGPSLVSEYRGRTEDEAGRAGIAGTTILDAGRGGFGDYVAVGPLPAPALIWLTIPNGLLDCLWFWNMRALQSWNLDAAPVVLLPTTAASTWVGLNQVIDGLLARRYSGAPDAIILSHGIAEKRLRAFADKIGLQAYGGKFKYGSISWPAPEVRNSPFSYMINVDPRNWNLFERSLGYAGQVRVHRFRQSTVVPIGDAVLDRIGVLNAAPMLPTRLSGGYLDELPRRNSVARLVHRDARWRPEGLELVCSVSRGAELTITSPAPSEVLDALRSELAAETEASDKGRLAAALLEARDCSSLSEAGVLDVITALKTPRSKEMRKQLMATAPGTPEWRAIEIAAAWGGRAERTYKDISGIKSSRAQVKPDDIERLVAEGWAERGLQTDCQRCGTKTFVPLAGTSAQATCPGCGAPAKYAGTRGLDVMYRLDSLVDRACDQGVLPHLACLAALRRRQPESHLYLGMNIAWTDGPLEEVDLYGYMGASVVSGEVKTAASEFNREQLQRDVALSARIRADVHVLAAATAMPTTVIETAKQLVATTDLRLMVVAPSDSGDLVATVI